MAGPMGAVGVEVDASGADGSLLGGGLGRSRILRGGAGVSACSLVALALPLFPSSFFPLFFFPSLLSPIAPATATSNMRGFNMGRRRSLSLVSDCVVEPPGLDDRAGSALVVEASAPNELVAAGPVGVSELAAAFFALLRLLED